MSVGGKADLKGMSAFSKVGCRSRKSAGRLRWLKFVCRRWSHRARAVVGEDRIKGMLPDGPLRSRAEMHQGFLDLP
jgi:hypothetical protein